MTTTPYAAAIRTLEHLADNGDPDGWGDTDPGMIFTTGGCALYATALVDANPQWTVVAAGEPACLEYDPTDPDLRPCGDYGHNVCGCMIHHFYAASPDGWLHDIYGEHDPTGILDDKALHPITDTTLTCVLESWHCNAEQDDTDAAALAITLV
jgi:hypothetical protein